MKKLFIWWSRLLTKIYTGFWLPWWSNWCWQDAWHQNVPTAQNEKIRTASDARTIARLVYSKFQYQSDSARELLDSIVPPPQNYLNYLNGCVVDDCDGFHSTMYHFLYNSNLECYLMTVSAVGGGHCVVLFQLCNKWYVCDYIYVTPGHATPSEAIEYYNTSFQEDYKTKSAVFYNSLIAYNYDSGKFYHVSMQDLTRKEKPNA